MRLKCIFGGRPTPQVIWRKIGGILPTDGRFSTDSEGQEIVIRSLKFSDQGTYECRGSNGKIFILFIFYQKFYKRINNRTWYVTRLNSSCN